MSGYDFIGDGAAAAADALRDQGAGVTELINETWDRQDLKDGVIGGDPDVASISAHFDHNRALPASGNKTGLGENFTVSDVAGAGNLTNALVFSIGCHSGLSVPDVELALTDRADWAQTFAGEGATYLGNTGYGFGDTELVAYSERLQLLFAEGLQGGTPVGSALMAAKQAYFAELAVLTPYDQKVISEMTMYGLPMWRVGGALDAPAPVASAPTANAALAAPEPPDTVVQEPFVLSVGGPGTPSGPGVLAPKDTGNGTYYDVDGNVLAVQYRPAQPSVDRDVSRPGRSAHGALILDAESQDLTGFEPYYVQPVIDEAGNEQSTDPVGDAVFPATLARVANPVAANGSRSSSLVVAAGQFRRNGEAAGTGVQRLFTRLDTAVTYADASETDFDPPSIVRSEASVVESTVGFSVRASTDTQRVYVLYKVADGGPGNWEGVDLVRTGTDPVDGSALWTGGAVLPSADLKIEYLGQAVDPVGNVAYTVNKTTNFLAAPAEDCSLDATLSPQDTLTGSGWYRAADGVTVTFAQQGLQVSVDGGEFQAVPAGGLLITGEGVHRVSANSADARCTVIVPIDTRGPEIDATLDPAPNAGGWNAGPVNLNISASDPGGSGVRQVTYAVNGGAPVTVDGDSTSVPVDTRGDTTVTYSAVDAAGNAGASGTTTIRIDGGVPTVTSVVVPAPANGWNRGPVSVDITATDAETGIREIRTALGGAPPVVVRAASASVPVTAEGTTTVGYTAVDNAGNEATGSAEVRIDSVVPGIAITSPPANVATGAAATAGFTCSDQTSGVASCTATLAGPGVLQPVANGDPLPTTVNRVLHAHRRPRWTWPATPPAPSAPTRWATGCASGTTRRPPSPSWPRWSCGSSCATPPATTCQHPAWRWPPPRSTGPSRPAGTSGACSTWASASSTTPRAGPTSTPCRPSGSVPGPTTWDSR